MARELALITARNNRNKKKKEQLELQAPARKTVVNNTAQNKKTAQASNAKKNNTVDTKPTVQRNSNNMLSFNNRNTSNSMLSTPKRDNTTVKTSNVKKDKNKKSSITTVDIYTKGGRFYYEDNGKEHEVDRNLLMNAWNNNRTGVVGQFDKKGKFQETDSKGVGERDLANKNYLEKLDTYNKAHDSFTKKLTNELTKRGIDYSTQSNLKLNPQKETLNFANRNEQTKNVQQNLMERAARQQPLIEEANKATEKERQAANKATNDYILAKYQKNVADVENEDVGFKDKTLGTFTSGFQDILSNFNGETKYIDQNGNEIYLPSKGELKWNKIQNSYGNNFIGKLAKWAGNVSHEGGKIAGASLVDLATGGLGGKALYFSDVFGDIYKQNINDGYSSEKAGTDALLKTGQSIIKQKLIGGLGGKLTGGGPSWLEKSLNSKWATVVKNPLFSQTLASMSSEAIDEATDEWIESGIDSLVLGKDFDPVEVFWNSLYSGSIGGATGAFGGIGDRVTTSLDENRLALQELNTIADQRIQQIQEEVQQDPSRAQEAVQEMQDIQNYVQAQTNIIQNQAKTQAQESETAQPSAIPQETQNVAQNREINNNYASQDLEGPPVEEERTPYSKQMTQEEADAMQRAHSESLDRMADGRVGRTPGEQLIKDNNVSDRRVNAIQYDNPEIKKYYKQAAEVVGAEAYDAKNQSFKSGIREQQDELGRTEYRRYAGWNGFISKDLSDLARNGHLTAKQIEKAADDIIEDNGKENNANAKKLEKILDKRLRKGYSAFGDNFEPNQDYINEIESIAYEKQRQGELESLEDSSKTVETNETTQNNQQESTQESTFNNETKLEERVSGDKLLDTQDFINEVKEVGAKVDDNGYVTVYHQTTPENAQKILDSGKMTSNEQAVFFSTSENASQADGRGNVKLEFKIPAENLELDDLFSDNADVKINLNGAKDIDISNYLVNNKRTDNVETNQNENIPATKENVISEEAKQQQETTKQNSENVNTNPNKQSRVENDVIAEKITNNINNAVKGKDVFEKVEEATGKPIRRGIKTITTATGTTQLVSTMDGSIITYDPQSNESTLNKARDAQKGMTLDEKYQDCLDFINSDKRIKAVDIAKIELTLKELQLKGDAEKFSNLVQYAATLGTTDAQALQMMSVIKKMNPMSQLETLQKLIQKEQSKGNKIYDGVKINQELVKKVLDTQNANGEVNQDQFYEAMEDLKNDIAKQMKSTAIDKANSFRYLAMLGNPKTHIRNVVGNGFMFGLQSFKDVIGTVGEVAYDTTLKATGKEGMQERTKTFKTASKEVREYVNKKVDDFFSKNKTTNKYNESMKGLSGDLESRRNIFSNNNVIGRALNKASSINNNALDKMDKYFSTAMTKKAMKNYLTANGIRTNAQIESNPEMVARALDYALFKGKEATFHQDSKTASIIRNAREQARTGSGYTKAVGLALDATMPFVSTPVNIAKTAMEYTPIVGLGDLNTQLKNSPKEIRGAVIIDHISKQFAGLSLLCLGMGLAASGKIKGAGEGDKEDKTEKNLGNAQYSIKFGNNTYDLSWISPSAVPLFEGVEIYNKYAKNKDVNVGAMVDTFFGALNPVTDMSVLQSIERTLTTLAYGKNAVQSLGETTFSSYLSQYIPTLSSQFAQWFDTKQRDSNTRSNALEKTFDQIKYKIPATTEFTGVGKWLNKNITRKSLPEKVDIWGEENKNAENFWQRGFEAFLSPANRKEYKVDSTTKELERLARETDDTTVLPTSKDKSVKINGEEHELKGKDFVDLQKTYGKTAKKNLDELIKSDSYKKASDAEKKSMVGKLYDYATYKAKENYAKNKDINFDSGNQTSFAMIDAFKIPYEKYVENKVSGNESATKILNKLNEAGFSEIQKGAVMNFYDRAYYVDEEKLYNTLKNSGLSNKQKELIKAKYKKNITDSERERYKRADNMGIDYDLYTNFRSFVSNTKGESRTGGLTKKQKVINWIQKQKLSAKQKQNLYDDYINNQRTFSYYK